LSLQGDLSCLLGVLAQAAREVHDRFVDAGQRNLDAEVGQLRADAWPFTEKIWRGREVIFGSRGKTGKGARPVAEAPEADTRGAPGVGVAPCVWDGADVSPSDTSAATAAEPVKKMIMEPATPRTSIPFLHPGRRRRLPGSLGLGRSRNFSGAAFFSRQSSRLES
jgi:hypothetical protein